MKLPGEGAGKNRKRALLAIAAIAVAVGYYLLSQQLGHLDLQQLLEDISNTLGAWTYLFVGVFAFAETGAFVGLVVPGETVMLLGGAVAGQGAINIYLLIAIAWFAAWLGDTTSFFIGRRLGREFVIENGPRFGISHERFEKVEDYFSRHGGKTIFIGRFISLVRAFAPFIAGSSGMRYRAFVPYSILGTGLWASAHILVGYFFSRSIDTAGKYAAKGAFALATLIVVVAGTIFLYRHFRQAENRRSAVRWMEAHRATRWLVVLGRRYEPQLRFLWDRVTPGGTFGLEFTSLMATLAVALFVLDRLHGHRRPRSGADPRRRNRVRSRRTPPQRLPGRDLEGRHRPRLGRLHLVADGGLRGAARLAPALDRVLGAGGGDGDHRRRHPRDQGRGRPPAPAGPAEVTAVGSSFPSGHAAHSVLYVWLAVTIVLRLRPGMSQATAVVAAGFALTILVGLSRVYLDVHYLSDVSAGWALGAAAFSFCAAVGLVISQVRQNPRQ